MSKKLKLIIKDKKQKQKTTTEIYTQNNSLNRYTNTHTHREILAFVNR